MIGFSALRVEFAPSPLAAPFLVLLALVAPAVALTVLGRGRTGQLPLLLAFVASMAAVLLAQTLAAFAIAWEAMALVSAFLVAAHHERRPVRRALFVYLLIGQAGALCVFAALALLALHANSVAFSGIARAAATLSPAVRTAVVLLALAGFGSKAGLLPLHFWLPRAHPVAPSAASALLSGVMLKIAVYGLLLVCCVFVPAVGVPLSLLILAAGLVTALAGALHASVETDLKRLLAFSSIENIGIIASALGFALLALALDRPALAGIALAALFFHVFAHGLFKSLLFLGAGEIAAAAHTTDLEHLGGLTRTLRYSSAAIVAGFLAAAALPPFCGFASEWLLLQALLRSFADAPPLLQGAALLAALALGAASGIAAIAFAKAVGVGMLGSPRSAHPRELEPFTATPIALGWLAALTLLFGAAPVLLLRPLLALVGSMLPGGAAPALPVIPVWIGALPAAGAALAFVLAKTRGVRRVPTWTCGSPVTARSQYTATAFANPLLVVFGELTRSHVDGVARVCAALIQRFARRARVVQAGYVRIYLAYALVALVVVLVIAR